MPEPYWPKRKASYRLSDAEKNTRYACIKCSYCKQERYFLLAELKVAFGNIECDDVVYQQRWRCTGCNGAGILHLTLQEPPAAGGVTVRRLDRVNYVRKLVWRDERR